MPRITEFSTQDHVALQREAQSRTRNAPALETAAQAFTDLLYETFPQDILLARVFATIAYGELPSGAKQFVDQLATSAGIAARVHDDTLVLTLLGTSGAQADWNDRRASRGHVGIPLATSDFIGAIPMVSRLLGELGVGLDWIDTRDTAIVARSLGSSSGLFYVRDAAEETDHLGRKIIAAREFVREHGVKTVFGMGGGYIGTSCFLACIVFCNTEVARARVEAFMGLINRIKVSTLDLAKQGRVFVE